MLSDRQLATILAALLYWREEVSCQDHDTQHPYFASLGLETFEPLSTVEVSTLMDELYAQLRRS